MAALNLEQVQEVFVDTIAPGIQKTLSFKAVSGEPAWSIPWEHWSTNVERHWEWWKRVFQRAGKKGLKIHKVHFDKDGRTGFSFYPKDSETGVSAQWWVERAEKKIREATVR